MAPSDFPWKKDCSLPAVLTEPKAGEGRWEQICWSLRDFDQSSESSWRWTRARTCMSGAPDQGCSSAGWDWASDGEDSHLPASPVGDRRRASRSESISLVRLPTSELPLLPSGLLTLSVPSGVVTFIK